MALSMTKAVDHECTELCHALCLLVVEARKGNTYGKPCLPKTPFYLLASLLRFARPKHSAACNALRTVSAPQVLKPTFNHWQGQHCSLQAPACHPQPSLVLHRIAHQVLKCNVHCLMQIITFLVALLVQFIQIAQQTMLLHIQIGS